MPFIGNGCIRTGPFHHCGETTHWWLESGWFTRGWLAKLVGQTPEAASVGAFAHQSQPAGSDKLVLGSRAAFAAAPHQAFDPAKADERAAGALVGKGGQQRAQEIGRASCRERVYLCV